MTHALFGAVATAYGTAANNRGLTEGNVSTLQKLVWQGQVHTTVSAEAIRFALRRLRPSRALQPELRRGLESQCLERSRIRAMGRKSKETPFIDDDLLGFMSAEGAKEEGGKGTANVTASGAGGDTGREPLPWAGDVTFNAASPGATPAPRRRAPTLCPTARRCTPPDTSTVLP